MHEEDLGEPRHEQPDDEEGPELTEARGRRGRRRPRCCERDGEARGGDDERAHLRISAPAQPQPHGHGEEAKEAPASAPKKIASRYYAPLVGSARTLTQKIIDEHLAGSTEEEIELRIDQILLEDATGTMACLQFERLGVDRVAVPTVSYVDHNVLQFDNKNSEDHAYLRSWAARYGPLYSRPGNGISHYLHLERFARPGQVLLGADSHTTMAGALGMLAIGAGATEVAVAMAGKPYVLERPLESPESSCAADCRLGCSRRTSCSSCSGGETFAAAGA